jgi:hypothetical protein
VTSTAHTRPASAHPVAVADRLPGADAFALDRPEVVRPDGIVHLVDAEWDAACGAGRVRYVFPSRADDPGVQWCAKCVTALTRPRVPRQRKSR